MKRTYRKYSDDDFKEAISKNYTWSGVIRQLGLKQAGGTTRYMKNLAKKLEVNISHFKPSGWNLTNQNKIVPLGELLTSDSSARSNNLKNRLFKEGMIENTCDECGQLPIWNDKPLTLELHHKDGNSRNNLLKNLQILCPHCHSQTEGFRQRKSKRNCIGCSKEVTRHSKTGFCISCSNKNKSFNLPS